MFDEKETTLQRICALMLWSSRIASSAADVAMGLSLDPNPVGELENALQRIQSISREWLMEIDPRYGGEEQQQAQAGMRGESK